MIRKNYTFIYLGALFIILTLTFISYKAITYSGGPPAGMTNAPGENNCTSCHSGTLITSGSNWSNMTLNTDIPGTGYLPDSVYTITLSHSQSGINTWGFEITALRSSNNTMAGSFTITNSAKTQKLTSGSKEYVVQTSSGTSGSGSNSWSFQWKAPSSNVGDIKFYAVVNAANGNGLTSGDQIYSKNWTFSVSSLLPTATITPSKTSICVGDTLFLTGGGNNSPSGFEWSMPGGNPSSSTSQNPFVVYSSAGSKTITLITTNSKGKSLPATVNITVNALPTATITISGNTKFCPGDSVILTAPSGSGLSYLWSTGEKTRSINVKTTGSFWVKVTNSSGCSAVSSEVKTTLLQVSSNQLQASDDSICSGSPLQLTATAGFSSYTFYDGKAQLGSGNQHTLTTSTLSPSNDLYSIAFDTNGCKSESNHLNVAVVQQANAPVVKCGNSTTSSVTFTWNSRPYDKVYEVSTDTGKTWINIGKDTTFQITGLTYSTDVLLQLRAQDFTPCGVSSITTQVCQSESCSPISFKIENDSIICKGDSAQIQITGLHTSAYAVNFNGQGYAKDTIFRVKPQVSTNYSISLIDSSALNCPPIVKNIRIEVENIGLKLTNDLDSNRVCEGETVHFEATAGLTAYHFYLNGNLVKSGKENTYSTHMLNNNDLMYVIGTSSLGCTYYSDTQSIVVFPKPNIQLISDKNNHTLCEGQSISFTASPTFEKYHFILNSDTVYSGASHQFTHHQPKNNDAVYVHATDMHGCKATSQTITVHVNPLPRPGFTYTQNGLNFTFTDTTSQVAWRLWNFGDMTDDTAKTTTHTYSAEGKYEVKLTVTDHNGCADMAIHEVEATISGIHVSDGKSATYKAYKQAGQTLRLEYYLPQRTLIEIWLLNAGGQKVRLLTQDESASGAYRKDIQVGELQEGIYFVRFVSGNGTQTVKVILP